MLDYFSVCTHNTPQYVGFWLAFTLPTFIFLLCPIVLWAARSRYTHTPPTGSVLATAFQLYCLATRGRWSINPVRTWRQLNEPDLWENAKPSQIEESQRPRWMTFDDGWVDEVKRGLKVYLASPLLVANLYVTSEALLIGLRCVQLFPTLLYVYMSSFLSFS